MFVGKILPDVQRRYLPPELNFTCMGDVLKRYTYMLLGKQVHLYTNEYWKELDDPVAIFTQMNSETFAKNKGIRSPDPHHKPSNEEDVQISSSLPNIKRTE